MSFYTQCSEDIKVYVCALLLCRSSLHISDLKPTPRPRNVDLEKEMADCGVPEKSTLDCLGGPQRAPQRTLLQTEESVVCKQDQWNESPFTTQALRQMDARMQTALRSLCHAPLSNSGCAFHVGYKGRNNVLRERFKTPCV